MTPKQKYDERKRLRLERELHFERIADAMELWADIQFAGSAT